MTQITSNRKIIVDAYNLMDRILVVNVSKIESNDQSFISSRAIPNK